MLPETHIPRSSRPGRKKNLQILVSFDGAWRHIDFSSEYLEKCRKALYEPIYLCLPGEAGKNSVSDSDGGCTNRCTRLKVGNFKTCQYT